MAKVNVEVKLCIQAEESARNTKVQQCLVCCSRVKKTLSEALCPSDPPTLGMKDPSQPGRRTTDLREVSRNFSDTLLHFGGHSNYLPQDRLVQDLLTHSCNLQAWECHSANQLLRQESRQTVWVYLNGSASRGGYGSAATVYLPNGTTLVLCLPSTSKSTSPLRKQIRQGVATEWNAYTFWAAPGSVQHFIWKVCNLHVSSPISPKWLKADISLLYKKGDPKLPSNYRPIALLNTIYKVIATHATVHLSRIALNMASFTPPNSGPPKMVE